MKIKLERRSLSRWKSKLSGAFGFGLLAFTVYSSFGSKLSNERGFDWHATTDQKIYRGQFGSPPMLSKSRERVSTKVRLARVAFTALCCVSTEGAARMAKRLFYKPDRDKYHATPEQQVVLAAGEELLLGRGLAATSWGEGSTVLLVHGWQRNRSSLATLVQPLVKSGFRVVALDAPAHGDSPGTETNPSDYAEALLEVGKDLGPLHAVVSHSLGANALAIALNRGFRVGHAVLLAPTISVAPRLREFCGTVGMTRGATERFISLVGEDAGIPLDELDSAELGSEFDHPTLVIHDPEDNRVPFADGQRVANTWPSATLVPAPGVGHHRILQDPAVVKQVASFVSFPSRYP